MRDIVIAVDPGREKCGVAVVDKHAGVVEKTIVETGELKEFVSRLATAHNITTVVLGDRTSSQSARKSLEQICIDKTCLRIEPVDEHRSTDEARRRYWRENPPRGIRRLIPVTLQSVPVPVDDYVAVILAERYFASKSVVKDVNVLTKC